MQEAIEEIVKDATEFMHIFQTRKKSEALAFYRDLPEDTKKYIKETKPYSLCLRSAQCIC